MVWHIFKKDFRLLWPLSLTVVLLGALAALRAPVDGYFFGSELENLTFFLPTLTYIGIAIAAVTVVHQDALCDVQDDWLVRPISRRDLVLAKVLFVLLTVNVPLMIVDILVQTALHFPLSVSVGVAASRALLMVFMYSLPALMLGAVTRSFVNAFATGIVSVFGLYLLMALSTSILSPDLFGFSAAQTISWVPLWAAGAMVAIGSAATLALQYATRLTLTSLSLGAVTVVSALSIFIFLPNAVALFIQQSFWTPTTGNEIRLSFDPSGREDKGSLEKGLEYRATPLSSIGPPSGAADAAAQAAYSDVADRRIAKVGLPLSVSGMHAGDILFADQIVVRLWSMSGQLLYKGPGICTRQGAAAACSADRLEVWASSATVRDEEELDLPNTLYQRIKNEPIRVEVSYALTRLVPRSTQMIDAIEGQKSLYEAGSCTTRVDGDGDEIQLGCLTDVGIPSCTRLVLEDPKANRRNPDVRICNPTYGPYRRGKLEEAVDREQLSLHFHDPSGLAHYPVDSAQIAHARIDVTAYDPIAHFRTSVTVPGVRLAEWAPATPVRD